MYENVGITEAEQGAMKQAAFLTLISIATKIFGGLPQPQENISICFQRNVGQLEMFGPRKDFGISVQFCNKRFLTDVAAPTDLSECLNRLLPQVDSLPAHHFGGLEDWITTRAWWWLREATSRNIRCRLLGGKTIQAIYQEHRELWGYGFPPASSDEMRIFEASFPMTNSDLIEHLTDFVTKG